MLLKYTLAGCTVYEIMQLDEQKHDWLGHAGSRAQLELSLFVLTAIFQLNLG